VRAALNRMVEGRTALIIAHRLSTIQRADKIIVMHKGQVREMERTSNFWRSAGSITSCISCSIRIKKSACGEPCTGECGQLAAGPANVTSSTRYNAAVQVLISAGEASGEMYGAQLMRRCGGATHRFSSSAGGSAWLLPDARLLSMLRTSRLSESLRLSAIWRRSLGSIGN